jgi:hypothetical protein
VALGGSRCPGIFCQKYIGTRRLKWFMLMLRVYRTSKRNGVSNLSLKLQPQPPTSIGLLSDFTSNNSKIFAVDKTGDVKPLNYIRTRWRKFKSYHGAIVYLWKSILYWHINYKLTISKTDFHRESVFFCALYYLILKKSN